ncbi:DUF4160 domain-containing protein [Streptococcus danieliae]|nr:DUF4160 domain-containing protein [Streptococcus danieliae]
MPKTYYGKYGIEVRTNEHNHKGQKAHVHVYIHGVEVGAFFLDGQLMVGNVKRKDRLAIEQLILSNRDEFQAMWDEFQKSTY